MVTVTVVSLLACFVANALAYPNGPPVAYFPALCSHMTPNHGADPQTTEAPFDIVLAETCYGPGTTMQVRIRVMDPEEMYFEGFLVQARVGEDDSDNYGTFDAMETEGIQELTCHGNDMSAIGHSEHEHYLARTFEWTAPDSDVGDIHFAATIVKGQSTFWVAVESETIMFDENCASESSLEPEEFPDVQPPVVCEEGDMTCGCEQSVASLVLLFAMLLVLKM